MNDFNCMKPVVMISFLLAVVLFGSSCLEYLVDSEYSYLSDPEYLAYTEYQHDPSAEFYKTWNFSAEYLSPFTSNNILFSVDAHLYSDYVILLKLFTPPPGQSVFIHEAKIQGANRQLTNAINAEFNVTDEMRNRDLVAARIHIFDVEEKLLDEMRYKDGTLPLEVSYSIDGVFGVMNFTLVRRPWEGRIVLPWPIKMTVYQHDSTEKFYESWDPSANYISPFTVNDIVFTTTAKAFGYAEGTYDIWNYTISLNLFANSPGQSVFIHEAKIKGADWQLTKAVNSEFSVTQKALRNPAWTSASVDLFDIRDDEMEKMMLDNGGALTLEVGYSIDGVFSVMSFTLVRRIKKDIWWIT